MLPLSRETPGGPSSRPPGTRNSPRRPIQPNRCNPVQQKSKSPLLTSQTGPITNRNQIPAAVPPVLCHPRLSPRPSKCYAMQHEIKKFNSVANGQPCCRARTGLGCRPPASAHYKANPIPAAHAQQRLIPHNPAQEKPATGLPPGARNNPQPTAKPHGFNYLGFDRAKDALDHGIAYGPVQRMLRDATRNRGSRGNWLRRFCKHKKTSSLLASFVNK